MPTLRLRPCSIFAAAWSDHCASPVFGCQQVLEQDPGTLIEGAPCRWRSRYENRIGTVCFTTGCAGDAGFGQGLLEGRRRRWGGGSLCRPSRRHRSSRGLPHRAPPGQEARPRAAGNAAVRSRQDMSLPGIRLPRKFRSLFRCSNSAIDGTVGIENEPASSSIQCRRGRGGLLVSRLPTSPSKLSPHARNAGWRPHVDRRTGGACSAAVTSDDADGGEANWP